MKKALCFTNYDPQEMGPQHLEDLATGYWYSEVLFTAVELGIFSHIGPGGVTGGALARTLRVNAQGLRRFLQALQAIGLVTKSGRRYFNTQLASGCLVKGKAQYQGGSILWRKYLQPNWRGLKDCLKTGGRVAYSGEENSAGSGSRIAKYIGAMDGIAQAKAGELVGFFADRAAPGRILDVGAGSGAITAAFLARFPLARATLLDLPDILDHTKAMQGGDESEGRLAYLAANILEPWPVRKSSFDLVILSNILHAYSAKELPHILRSAAACLRKQGLLLLHDFFLEHCPEKAALSDLNMFVNTYNGRVFASKAVRQELRRLGLACTEMIPLKTDTAVLFAAKDETALASLEIDPLGPLTAKILALGFRKVYPLTTGEIHIPDGTDLRCRFGCAKYGRPHCPPHSLTPPKTRELIKDYRRALLLEGQPPTRDFQLQVLAAEGAAFKAGFHKAFAFWAGPCSLCKTCVEDGPCRNTAQARSSMEGAGIDVYATAKNAGATLKTLKHKGEFVKYFALILLE